MDAGVGFAILAAVLGSAVGSFLNVVIYRVPAGLSVVKPKSHCPVCQTPIKVWQNIPIFGWLLVRGRCASCRAPISPRYPLVELAMALLTLALMAHIAGGLVTPELLASKDLVADLIGPFLLYLVFLGALVAATFIDLDHFVIPDAITLPGIVFGVGTSIAAGHAINVSWQDSLIGAGVGAGSLILVILVYGLITRREGMGGGDWKILGLIGAYLGWQALPWVLLAGSLHGLVFAVVFRRSFAVEELPPDPLAEGDEEDAGEPPEDAAEGKSFRHLAVPFGPFLALAALEYFFFAEEIQTTLAGLFGWSGT